MGFSFHKVTKGSGDFPVQGEGESPRRLGRGLRLGSPTQGPPGQPGSAGVGAERVRPAPLPPCPPCAAHGGFQVCGSRAGRAPPTGQLGSPPQTAPDPSGAPCAPESSPRLDGTTLGPSPVCTQAGLLLPPGDRLVSPLGLPLPQPSPSLVGPDDRVVSRPLPLPCALSLKSHQATSSHAWNHSPWSGENPCPRAATAACPGHPDLTSPAT